ncbi:Ig-like domain-containing protein, partial [Streptomyces sp. NPDC058766]|uniref:Ig-like domain-containing protein n=1 Tax=Streptomyces sp. NPDC058766 TaxID=3346630 RepID=UPI0036AEF0C8
ATVTPVAPGNGTPTGTLTLTGPAGLDQTTDLAPDGTTCITADNLTTGTITATYNGDTCFTPSTGTTPVTITPAASTVSLTADPTPSVCGQPVTVCATVTPVAPGNGTPTGTLTLTGPAGLDQTTDLAPDGTTCITTTMLETGLVTATYNGDGCFTPSTSSADVAVNPAASAVSVSAVSNTSVCGETVTVCATVTAVAPGNGTPTGTITFTGAGLDETVDVAVDGTACATTSSLTTGTVTATYSGDGCLLPSTGSADVTVVPAASTVSVTVDPSPSVCGQPVTVCATVTPVAPGSGTPTGSVTFLLSDGTTQAVGLDANGSACVTSSSLITGAVTAVYNGDGCFLASTGSADVTVEPAASSVSVTVDPSPSVCGQPVTVCATVTPVAPGSGT